MAGIQQHQGVRGGYLRTSLFLNRAFNVCASLALVVLTLPLMAAIALLVLVTSGKPVFYRGVRLGLNKQPFTMIKFRTLVRDADQIIGPQLLTYRHKLLTPLGKFLRDTRLDELPQLWNVLRGDMSLVGPRPEAEKWVAEYPERWAVVHRVRPGITDPACILYRHEEELLRACGNPEDRYRSEILPHKLHLYETYVRTSSFWGDVRIIFQSLWTIARR